MGIPPKIEKQISLKIQEIFKSISADIKMESLNYDISDDCIDLVLETDIDINVDEIEKKILKLGNFEAPNFPSYKILLPRFDHRFLISTDGLSSRNLSATHIYTFHLVIRRAE